MDREIRTRTRTWRPYGLWPAPQQSDHRCGHLQCLGAWWAVSWGIIQAQRPQGGSSPHGRAHPIAWTSARSSAARARCWKARHGAPLVRDPILHSPTKIRLALLHYSSDASRPSRPQTLDEHNVSGICLACERHAHLGRLALLRPAPQPWPLLVPSSSSPCLSSPSAAGRVKVQVAVPTLAKQGHKNWRSGRSIAIMHTTLALVSFLREVPMAPMAKRGARSRWKGFTTGTEGREWR